MAYIIGNYNKYDAWDRAHATYKFTINGNWYAVKEVEMCWGLPAIEFKVDERDDAAETYLIYETEDEAIQFAKQIKAIN